LADARDVSVWCRRRALCTPFATLLVLLREFQRRCDCRHRNLSSEIELDVAKISGSASLRPRQYSRWQAFAAEAEEFGSEALPP